MRQPIVLGLVVVLIALLGSVVAAEARSTVRAQAVSFPLKVAPSKRYLVDQHGHPFLIVGDSPQSMIVNLSLQDAKTYIADRKAAGFNSLWINLLCNTYTAGREDATTYDHIAPFSTPGDLSTPNERYFNRVDQIVRLANEDGMAVFLDPIETGGWLKVLQANGAAKALAYGRYLGKRYGTFPNIVWMSGNDFQEWTDTSMDDLVLAVARGIRSADPRHIQTVELNYPVSSSTDDRRWRSLIGLNGVYTYSPTYAEVLKAYNGRSVLPSFLVEAGYEFEQNSPSISYGNAETLRRQEYWSLLSGASGQFYGNKYTWQFLPDWKSYLDTPGSKQMAFVVKLFGGRPWYRLVPDQRHVVLTAGYGTFSASGSVDDSDYATLARTPDGKLAIAYLPTVRTVSIDTSKLAPNAGARWYDPTAGTFSKVVHPTSRRGTVAMFRPPNANRDGDGDWVLVFTAG
jgi:hypothetical protein